MYNKGRLNVVNNGAIRELIWIIVTAFGRDKDVKAENVPDKFTIVAFGKDRLVSDG
jgi:hypothetical protein